MKYISGLDHLFLTQETGTQFMHVAGLGLYNPSTAKDGFVRFKDVLAFFTQRMAQAPVFRRRLQHSLLDTGRPFWVEDPNVDVEYHVRHIALPAPGDWRQLMIQVARIHARPMDLTKPLWEAYIIEGLDNIDWLPEGSFVLYFKFHHVAIDGESGAHLIGNLHTLTPDYERSDKQELQTIRTKRPPPASEIMSQALQRRLGQIKGLRELGISLGGFALRTASRGSLRNMLAKNADVKTLMTKVFKPTQKRPGTRFNAPISSHRSLEVANIRVDECNQIRKQLGRATINDIFLTIVGGALRDYLTEKGEAPSGSLKGSMPMSLRGEDKTEDIGNQIAQVYYDLNSDIQDPIERLDAVSQEICDLKTSLEAGMGKDFQSRLLELLPASIIAKPITKALGDNANVNVSNVRGPMSPLYMAGARLERFVPFSIPMDGCGLNVTGFSYNGVLSIAITCCRGMMPDPERFAQLLEASFAELKAAALGEVQSSKQATRSKASSKKKSKTKKATRKKTVKKARSKKVSARKQAGAHTTGASKKKRRTKKRNKTSAS